MKAATLKNKQQLTESPEVFIDTESLVIHDNYLTPNSLIYIFNWRIIGQKNIFRG
jgi:hypothetical protein